MLIFRAFTGPKAIFCACFLASVAWTQPAEGPVIIFAGDVTLSDHVASFVGDDLEYVFARWGEIGPHDLFMVNLEHPVTTETKRVEKQYNFKLDPRSVATLKLGGVGLVNLANNHTFDYGPKGVLETIRALEKIGIPYVGAGSNIAEARSPVIMTFGSVRIGFLGYHGGSDFAARESSPGIAPRVVEWMIEDIRLLKDRTNAVVVNIHWGEELAPLPAAWQRRLARRLIEAGASVIVGHHPHVLQGVEMYRDGVIAYSLGNFVFGGNSRSSYDTAVLKIAFGEQMNANIIPVRVTKWQPSPAKGQDAVRILRLVQDRSAEFDRPLPISSENIP